MLPENEQGYLKQCWRCKKSYQSQSSFSLEMCEECWSLVLWKAVKISPFLWMGIPLWTSPLWIRFLLEKEPTYAWEWFLACLSIGLIFSLIWTIISCLLVLVVLRAKGRRRVDGKITKERTKMIPQKETFEEIVNRA